MAEMDVFKRRVADTLTWYADEVRPDVDAPAVARRVALEHPRRRAGSLSWRAAVPSRAWVLLLVAALLTALAGGMLIAGSRQLPKLRAVVPPVPTAEPSAWVVPPAMPAFVCPPGSTPDTPGPLDQARPAAPQTAAFDRRAGRLVVLADALTGVEVTGVETWTFDVCSNTWTQMHPDREPPTPGYRLVYDVDSDVTILIAYGKVWVYDVQADSWTQRGGPQTGATLWAYDPRSGLIVAGHDDAQKDLLGYDVETDTWIPIRQANLPADGGLPSIVAYDASVDRILNYNNAVTSLFDIRTGTWSSSDAETPVVIAGFGMSAPAIEYDEAAARTVIFGNDRVALYDATGDRWEVLDGAAIGRPDGWPVSMVYDPVNKRLVGCRWLPLYERKVDVVALDLVSREWTVLLEAGGGRPAP